MPGRLAYAAGLECPHRFKHWLKHLAADSEHRFAQPDRNRLVSEPQDTEWKGRAFVVSDPSGFLLTISSEMQA